MSSEDVIPRRGLFRSAYSSEIRRDVPSYTHSSTDSSSSYVYRRSSPPRAVSPVKQRRAISPIKGRSGSRSSTDSVTDDTLIARNETAQLRNEVNDLKRAVLEKDAHLLQVEQIKREMDHEKERHNAALKDLSGEFKRRFDVVMEEKEKEMKDLQERVEKAETKLRRRSTSRSKVQDSEEFVRLQKQFQKTNEELAKLRGSLPPSYLHDMPSRTDSRLRPSSARRSSQGPPPRRSSGGRSAYQQSTISTKPPLFIPGPVIEDRHKGVTVTIKEVTELVPSIAAASYSSHSSDARRTSATTHLVYFQVSLGKSSHRSSSKIPNASPMAWEETFSFHDNDACDLVVELFSTNKSDSLGAARLQLPTNERLSATNLDLWMPLVSEDEANAVIGRIRIVVSFGKERHSMALIPVSPTASSVAQIESTPRRQSSAARARSPPGDSMPLPFKEGERLWVCFIHKEGRLHLDPDLQHTDIGNGSAQRVASFVQSGFQSAMRKREVRHDCIQQLTDARIKNKQYQKEIQNLKAKVKQDEEERFRLTREIESLASLIQGDRFGV